MHKHLLAPSSHFKRENQIYHLLVGSVRDPKTVTIRHICTHVHMYVVFFRQACIDYSYFQEETMFGEEDLY